MAIRPMIQKPFKVSLNDTAFGQGVSDIVEGLDNFFSDPGGYVSGAIGDMTHDTVESIVNPFIESLTGGRYENLADAFDVWTGEKANQDNLAYQREYNEQVFNRADTQYQRTVADLRAAGLSSQLAAGSPSTVAGASQAPQRTVGNESAAIAQLVNLVNSIKQTNASTKVAEAQAENIGVDSAIKAKELGTYDERHSVAMEMQRGQIAYNSALTKIAQIDGQKKAAYWDAQISDLRKGTEYKNSLIQLCQKDQSLRDAQIIGEYQSHKESRARVDEINQRKKNLEQEYYNIQQDFYNKLAENLKINAQTEVYLKQAADIAVDTDIKRYDLLLSAKMGIRSKDQVSRLMGINVPEVDQWKFSFGNLVDKVTPFFSSFFGVGDGSLQTVPSEYFDLFK